MILREVEIAILPDGRMDRKNAALYLGLSVKTLATHATNGTGPRFIKRGRVFYFRNDLDNWLRDDPPDKLSEASGRRRPRCQSSGPGTAKSK
jgi:hypothetical protein